MRVIRAKWLSNKIFKILRSKCLTYVRKCEAYKFFLESLILAQDERWRRA